MNVTLFIALAVILLIIIFAMFTGIPLSRKGIVLVVGLIFAAMLAAVLEVMARSKVSEGGIIAVAVIGVLLTAGFVFGLVYGF